MGYSTGVSTISGLSRIGKGRFPHPPDAGLDDRSVRHAGALFCSQHAQVGALLDVDTIRVGATNAVSSSAIATISRV